MSYLSLQEVRTRQTAMETERHWWVSRLRQRIEELKPIARTSTNIGHWTQIEIESLEALIQERTR